MDRTLTQTIETCVAENGDLVRRWLRNEPGSWGALAAQAVLSQRALLGRSLTEAERRAVWSALWQRLEQIRQSRDELN